MSEETMTRNIIVTKVLFDIDIAKKDGGSYTGAKLLYTLGGKDYSKGIHNAILNNNADLLKGLKELEDGGPADIIVEKKGNFTNILSVKKATTKPKEANKMAPTNKSFKTTWDDSARQTAIIRQNALTNAVAFVLGTIGSKSTVSDVIQTAVQFNKFTADNDTTAAKEVLPEQEDIQESTDTESDMDLSDFL